MTYSAMVRIFAIRVSHTVILKIGIDLNWFGPKGPKEDFQGHFWLLYAAPKVLGQKVSQGPKNEALEKMKKSSPGIYPIYKCAKFQHDCAIL